jgi:hypothetical protein
VLLRLHYWLVSELHIQVSVLRARAPLCGFTVCMHARCCVSFAPLSDLVVLVCTNRARAPAVLVHAALLPRAIFCGRLIAAPPASITTPVLLQHILVRRRVCPHLAFSALSWLRCAPVRSGVRLARPRSPLAPAASATRPYSTPFHTRTHCVLPHVLLTCLASAAAFRRAIVVRCTHRGLRATPRLFCPASSHRARRVLLGDVVLQPQS